MERQASDGRIVILSSMVGGKFIFYMEYKKTVSMKGGLFNVAAKF